MNNEGSKKLFREECMLIFGILGGIGKIKFY
jgi:hypothetical protein